jgi:hypothetical protein
MIPGIPEANQQTLFLFCFLSKSRKNNKVVRVRFRVRVCGVAALELRRNGGNPGVLATHRGFSV